jgi:acyl carrier protein
MANPVKTSRTAAEVQDWLIDHLAREKEIPPGQIDADQPILSLGIDSVQIVTMMAKLEDWGGFRFHGNPLEDRATVAELARYVEELTRNS